GGPRVRQLDLAGLPSLLHLTPLEPHPRADEGGDQLVVLVAVFLPQIVLDPAAAERAVGDGAIEPVENHRGGDLVADPDRPVEAHPGLRMEAAETRPAHLDGAKAGEDEAGRGNDPPI